METVKCAICGKSFETVYSHAKYCGEECSREAARRRDALRVRTGRRKRRKRCDTKSLKELVAAADAANISYGKYICLRSMYKV